MQANRVRKIGVLGLLALCCISLVGCTFLPLTERAVTGTYEADAPWGKSILILHPDHSFDQTVMRDDHTRTHIKGTRRLDLLAGKNAAYGIIVFTPFLDVSHDHKGVPCGGAVPSISRGLLWGVTIAADPDYGISFDKE